MQTIWAPPSVFVLFRRIVNVVSSLSISHHYLLSKSSLPPEASERRSSASSFNPLQPFSWLEWFNRDRESLSFAMQGAAEATAEPPREPPPANPRRQTTTNRPLDVIHRLMNSPLLYDPIRAPRNPVVLCHGLYGFDVRGPAAFPMLRQHYWSNALAILRQKIGAEVIVTSVPATGSIAARARSLHNVLCGRASGRSINFVAHSMGGLDCRHLITHIKPTEYKPVSLTTIATPHRGSPFMDWCTENIGIGKLRQREHEIEDFVREATGHPHHHEKDAHGHQQAEDSSSKSSFTVSLTALPSSFTTLLLSLLDSPAYANLTTTYLTNMFNPHTPDDPSVRYFSVAGRIGSMNIWHPLWLPKMVLDGYEARERERIGDQWDPLEGGERWGNDGLVTVQSARWGEFLGIMEECDHWELRGARGIELDLWGGSGSAKEGEAHAVSEGWNLGDWGRFVKAWKREEKKARDVGAAVSERLEQEREQAEDGAQAKAKVTDPPFPSSSPSGNGESAHGFADDVVKASTEKLSAVFDWIVEQVPVGRSGADASAKEEPQPEVKKAADKSDLATKADLERFYVALCRKLYDEGL